MFQFLFIVSTAGTTEDHKRKKIFNALTNDLICK